MPGKKIDKHSTGGVGDKVSMVLAPLAASLDVIVPMISGRGLGHTGGTLDKLESIPGFRVFGSKDFFKKELSQIGVAMLGQTDSVVPADRQIYALRDVTATVESIPLITASIMSKKIAEGIDGLVLDVKFGNGAFMPQVEKAESLANHLIKVGSAFGKKVVAHLTSMEQPLGYKIGNWLEIAECIDCLHDKGPDDLMDVVYTLTSEMLILGGQASDREDALSKCCKAIADGSAFRKFVEMVKYQGGDPETVISPEKYPLAAHRQVLQAPRSGFISGFDTRQVGLAGVQLGAGRARAEDPVDPRAGIVLFRKIGDKVEKGEPLLEIYTNRKASLKEAGERLLNSIEIGEKAPAIPELILKRISA
ncbi:MAG: thymidine phosphorylase [Calditrichia bacterium]